MIMKAMVLSEIMIQSVLVLLFCAGVHGQQGGTSWDPAWIGIIRHKLDHIFLMDLQESKKY